MVKRKELANACKIVRSAARREYRMAQDRMIKANSTTAYIAARKEDLEGMDPVKEVVGKVYWLWMELVSGFCMLMHVFNQELATCRFTLRIHRD